MATPRAVVVGCGHYLPERVVENEELTGWVDTSDEWIRTRSGIERRHFAAEGEKTSDLAIQAARMALADAGLTGADIDAVVLATATPDQTFPSTATRVQAALGMGEGFAFDIQAVCAGFVFALANATALIGSGQAKRVLVIGAETFSRILDWNDRTTCVLFGDGAGAVILEAQVGTGTNADRGVLSTILRSDGRFNDLLYVDGGVSTTQTAGVLKMQGREVFKHAVQKLAIAGEEALEAADLKVEDVAWVVPHQANLRIIKATADRIGIPLEKIVVTVQDHGNTSAASIPLALSVANSEGRFKPGDLLLMEAIGGGLTWGAATLRW
ncbi:beta-ketoacyl-ACP synthase III [Oceanibium sediminis]|uniref:beta-ketoacyl-ACP synthase III n=1 Tax=Oceanibium sediminis TaxID=2026339 RepID=UPI000DD367D2|nr:beta-ketoacyl-ACP synthase III [Oceanibium sediminis]